MPCALLASVSYCLQLNTDVFLIPSISKKKEKKNKNFCLAAEYLLKKLDRMMKESGEKRNLDKIKFKVHHYVITDHIL